MFQSVGMVGFLRITVLICARRFGGTSIAYQLTFYTVVMIVQKDVVKQMRSATNRLLVIL